MYNVVMSTLRESDSTYDAFVLLGRFVLGATYEHSPNVECEVGKLAKTYIVDNYDKIKSWRGDFVVSKSTKELLDISVRKMDVKPEYRFRSNVMYKKILYWLDHYWRDALKQSHMSPTEVLNSIDMDKAAGFVLRQNGIKKKGEYFFKGGLTQIVDKAIMNEKMLWYAVGKLEKKRRAKYIIEKSLRTFIVQPSAGVYHHKRIYGKQGMAMKGFWWSAYGMNPFEGGVARLAAELNKFKYKFMWDAIRWDRIAEWMNEIYDLRDKYVNDDDFRAWVRENVINSFVVLPNGDLIYKRWGNNSGSAQTTPDNILGMSYIMLAIFAAIVNGDDYMMEHINDFMFAKMFGDDVVGSFTVSGVTADSFMEQAIETFQEFNIKLDPILVSENLEDMSFLGFDFKNDETYGWVPKFNLEVLANSFLFNVESIEPEGEISKLVTIMLMSAGNGEKIFNTFRDATLEVLLNFQCKMGSDIMRHGLPNYEETMSWYCGYEGSQSTFFNFFSEQYFDYSVLEDET